MADGTTLHALCRYFEALCPDSYARVVQAEVETGMRTIEVLTTSRIHTVRVSEDFFASVPKPKDVRTFLDNHECPRLFNRMTLVSGDCLVVSSAGVRFEPL